MQLKENERGLYLFFPTSPEQIVESTQELARLAGMLAIYATWDMYKVIWPALMKLQEQLRAAQTNKNPEECTYG